MLFKFKKIKKIALKSKVLNILKIRAIAENKKKSPILFIKIAFKADLLACKRVFQKLINLKEHKPTPSQPIKKIKKLLLVTKITIEKVNNDK